MSNKIKRIIPQQLIVWVKRCLVWPSVNKELIYLRKKTLHYSNTFAKNRNSALANLLVVSHVLEKGITMPERRLGFGYERVREIINYCNIIIDKWGTDYIELQAALADLGQYLDIHRKANFLLPDDIINGIEKLLPMLVISDDNCFSIRKVDYFKETIDFSEFAKSRHSVRWFADTPVDEGKLISAIKLAQTAPSACNRQATRVKIISSPEGKSICQILQNGNRGFGEKADKWLLITTELGDWNPTHLDIAYIDAGIFAMNLLYALQYYGICACTLNAHIDIKKREKLYQELGIPKSELPAVFILVGNPADEFMVPMSRRLKTEDIIQKI